MRPSTVWCLSSVIIFGMACSSSSPTGDGGTGQPTGGTAGGGAAGHGGSSVTGGTGGSSATGGTGGSRATGGAGGAGACAPCFLSIADRVNSCDPGAAATCVEQTSQTTN